MQCNFTDRTRLKKIKPRSESKLEKGDELRNSSPFGLAEVADMLPLWAYHISRAWLRHRILFMSAAVKETIMSNTIRGSKLRP